MNDQANSNNTAPIAKRNFPECFECLAQSPHVPFSIAGQYILRKKMTKAVLQCPDAKAAYKTISGGGLKFTQSAVQNQFTEHGLVKVTDEGGGDVKVGSYAVYEVGSLDGVTSSYVYSSPGILNWPTTLRKGREVHKAAKKTKAKLLLMRSPTEEDMAFLRLMFPDTPRPAGDGTNSAASMGGGSPPSPPASAAAAAAAAGTNSASSPWRADTMPGAAGASGGLPSGMSDFGAGGIYSPGPDASVLSAAVGAGRSPDGSGMMSGFGADGFGADGFGAGGVYSPGPDASAAAAAAAAVGAGRSPDGTMDPAAAAGQQMDRLGGITTPSPARIRKWPSLSSHEPQFTPETSGALLRMLDDLPSSSKKPRLSPPGWQNDTNAGTGTDKGGRGTGTGTGVDVSSPLLFSRAEDRCGAAGKRANAQLGGAATGLGAVQLLPQCQQFQEQPGSTGNSASKATGVGSANFMEIEGVVGKIANYCSFDSIGRLVCASKFAHELIFPGKDSNKASVIEGDSSVWSLLCDAGLGQSCHERFVSHYRQSYRKENNLGDDEDVEYPNFSRDIYMAHVVGSPIVAQVFRELDRTR